MGHQRLKSKTKKATIIYKDFVLKVQHQVYHQCILIATSTDTDAHTDLDFQSLPMPSG